MGWESEAGGMLQYLVLSLAWPSDPLHSEGEAGGGSCGAAGEEKEEREGDLCGGEGVKEGKGGIGIGEAFRAGGLEGETVDDEKAKDDLCGLWPLRARERSNMRPQRQHASPRS